MGYGVINEQGFPYEDTNEGYKKLNETESEKVDSMFKEAPEEPSSEPNK